MRSSAPLGPTVVGSKVTCRVSVPSAGTVVGSVGAPTRANWRRTRCPAIEIPEIVSGALPVLVTVTAWLAVAPDATGWLKISRAGLVVMFGATAPAPTGRSRTMRDGSVLCDGSGYSAR